MTPESIITFLSKIMFVAIAAYWAIVDPLKTAVHFVAFVPVILLCWSFWGKKSKKEGE